MATAEEAFHPVEREAIEDLQRQLAAAEQRIQQLQAAVPPSREDVKDAEEYTTIAITALKDAQEKGRG